MFVIGLTGSMATGKSSVLDLFAETGASVFSADAAVHDLYAGAASAPIAAAFPDTVRNGIVDRNALGTVLVENPQRLAELEAIVHPLVREKLTQFLATARAGGAGLAVVDIPLLFETGHDYGFDAVAVTWCADGLARARALARPGMTVEKYETILARQLPQAEKKARARYLFDTGRPLRRTRAEVRALAAALAASPNGIV